MKKYILAATLMAAFMTTAFAQSGTNSSYSQYGLGLLSDQSTGFNRGMNGVGIGFHERNQVNVLNPASYSAFDSLTFVFDAGFSGQITNMSEGGQRINAKNADFEYAVAGFRAMKHLGISFGLIPYSNIGYNYATSGYVGGLQTVTQTTTYSGSGGVHQAYIGAGWEPIKGLAVGANVSFLWGDYSKGVSAVFDDSYAYTTARTYIASYHSYKLDFGVQYTLPLSVNNYMTIGATYSPGHSIGGNPQVISTSTNSTTTKSDTIPNTENGDAELNLDIPSAYGVGLMWNYKNKLKLGLDYSFQNWSKLNDLYYYADDFTSSYVVRSGNYMDRHKITLGGQITPNEMSRSFFNRVQYRFGMGYTSPYYKINGADGPKEYSVSAGFGIPIVNAYNNRSTLNISGQWVHTDGALIKENTFRINIGFTFNEKWFMKWKVE